MSAYPVREQPRNPTFTDARVNPSVLEVVELADWRYQQVLSAARRFLEGARSFGYGTPPANRR